MSYKRRPKKKAPDWTVRPVQQAFSECEKQIIADQKKAKG
jgi:hypothetical protein